jgi:enolase
MDDKGSSEQRLMEKYIQDFAIEECLDEVLNQVVTERPPNPYVAIARLIELKTLPEILGIKLKSVLMKGHYCVKAIVLTNIGSFEATMPYDKTQGTTMKEYAVLESKIRELFLAQDPTHLSTIDQLLSSVESLEKPESMAISVACYRATARLRNKPLHQLFADQVESVSNSSTGSNSNAGRALSLPLPLPVMTLAIRPQNNSLLTLQAIQVYATKATSIEMVIEKYQYLYQLLMSHEKIRSPTQYTVLGTMYLDEQLLFGANYTNGTLEDLAKFLTQVIQSDTTVSDLKLGLVYHGDELLKSTESQNPSFSYLTDITGNPNSTRSGYEFLDASLTSWTEMEFIAMDSPVAFHDFAAARYLRKVMIIIIITIITIIFIITMI